MNVIQEHGAKGKDHKAQEKQKWAHVAKSAIEGIRPGWVLAIAVMFLGMMGLNYLSERERAKSMVLYLKNSQEGWKTMEGNRSQEIRRCQETIRNLSETIGRYTDRQSRAQTKGMMINPSIMKRD